MNQRVEYLLQILEKIGVPLMTSIMGAGAAHGNLQDEARAMAEMLSRTVVSSIEISKTMDLASTPDQGDSLRLALTALSSSLIGAYYKNAGKVPGEADIKRMTGALQAVVTFSENFAPDETNTARLSATTASGAPTDLHQINVQFLQAFIPIVNAIGAFPFGQPEQKLIMDVSSRLVQRASEMGSGLIQDNLPDIQRKAIELALLRTLASVYAAAHEAETARLMNLSDDARGGGLSMDGVWQSFELRAAMLETLAQNMLPGVSGGKTAAKAPVPPNAPIQKQPTSPPPAAKERPAQTPPHGSNPMSMFAKKPSETPEEKASIPPPVKPSGHSSGNPMSFFKPPKNSDEN